MFDVLEPARILISSILSNGKRPKKSTSNTRITELDVYGRNDDTDGNNDANNYEHNNGNHNGNHNGNNGNNHGRNDCGRDGYVQNNFDDSHLVFDPSSDMSEFYKDL